MTPLFRTNIEKCFPSKFKIPSGPSLPLTSNLRNGTCHLLKWQLLEALMFSFFSGITVLRFSSFIHLLFNGRSSSGMYWNLIRGSFFKGILSFHRILDAIVTPSNYYKIR